MSRRRKTGRENGRNNDQRSGNESSRGKLGDIFEKEGHDEEEEKREHEEGGQDERDGKKVKEEWGRGEG